MSRPWMKFYPSDWRSEPALRLCGIAARGLWIEMLCLMHEAEPRGSLVVKGKSVAPRQLASLTGSAPKEVDACISELEEAGVFSRDPDGTIFSRRMRRDEDKAARDKANGSSGGNPALKGGVNPQDKPQHNPHRNPPVNRGDKAQILEARKKPSQDRKFLDEGIYPDPESAQASGQALDHGWDDENPFSDGGRP